MNFFFCRNLYLKFQFSVFWLLQLTFLLQHHYYIDNNSKAIDLLLNWFCGGVWLGIRSCERFGPTVREKIGTSFWIIWNYFKSKKVSKISGTWSDIGQQNPDWPQPSWEIRASTEAGGFFLSDCLAVIFLFNKQDDLETTDPNRRRAQGNISTRT